MLELFSPKTEEKILEFWQKNRIFEKSLENRKKAKKFIFFEGPPSANGKPGVHHVLSRVYKDIICRYKTMVGFYVPRQAGWDTHGLPIELQVEKELGIKHKADIEKYGIDRFNKKAKETVWTYKKEWDDLTRRIGFWLDLDDPYITYEPGYIESLWHIISQVASRNLLYQDFKVVPYCPRCETALSSHEVALGYEKVAEDSVYLKFKLKKGQKIKTNQGVFSVPDSAFILSWTTTPWTLAGNVALAVRADIEYEILKLSSGEILILGKDLRAEVLGSVEIKWSKMTFGKNLVGLSYQPLFDIKKLKNSQSHKVYAADFVNVKEGTGVVHTAVMYGEDDFNLGQKVGLPKFHTVDLEGKFIKGLGFGLSGLLVKSQQAEQIIFDYLKKNGNLFKIAQYLHDYPFCWRCQSALLYYAKNSWFVAMAKLRRQLTRNNKKINWVPGHIKEGRFGEWLKELKDWAISRERYWGTPLPVWQCGHCGAQKVIGSLAEFDKLSLRKSNDYVFLRHGQAENNRLHISSSWPEKGKYPLTLEGVGEVEKLISWFKKRKIDLIFSSDLLRASQSAEIIARALGKKLVFDKRIREHNFGIYNGRPDKEWHALFGHRSDQYRVRFPEGENLGDVKKRMMDFLRFLDRRYENKRILIVSHANPILVGAGAYQGYSDRGAFGLSEKFGIDRFTASTLEMSGHRWPYNDEGDLDLHRPFVDEIELRCEKCARAGRVGKKNRMKRVKEVIDVWFDSGAMPFAQWHWPFFALGGEKKLEYPADFIAEGVDQTRGWFYTLLAVSTLMGKGPAYRNVISLGHVLDERGEKMSKSKGNVVDPWQIISQYGTDALRWYFFTVNPAGESKNFNEKEVSDRLKNFILILWNVLNFYKIYGQGGLGFRTQSLKLKLETRNLNILDRWILSCLQGTVRQAKSSLDRYDVTAAARAIGDLVSDLSHWWLRRSRRRFQKPLSQEDFEKAVLVLRTNLAVITRILAPFTPFLSEAIFQELEAKSGSSQSIHLQDWPQAGLEFRDQNLEKEMNRVRSLAALGLALRSKAGIKTRQPLASASVNIDLDKDFLGLLAEELNVKKVKLNKAQKEAIILDLILSPELVNEGKAREFIRQIQEMRRDAGFRPHHQVMIYLEAPGDFKKVLDEFRDLILKETRAKNIQSLNSNLRSDIKKTFSQDGFDFEIALRKV